MELARYKLPVLFFLLCFFEMVVFCAASGALNNKAPKELEEKIHPLGVFEGMKVIMSETWSQKVGGFPRCFERGSRNDEKLIASQFLRMFLHIPWDILGVAI